MSANPRPLLIGTLSGRANAFDLVRLTACFLIVAFHGWALTGTQESSNKILDITFGHIGLLMLFGISGFLVTASWHSDQRIRAYFVKRGLRLLPGLWVSVFVCFIFAGFFLTSFSVSDYFSSWDSWAYPVKCSLLNTFNTQLPGVFTDNPYGDVVNGSLWTVPVEVLCWGAVVGAAVLGALKRPWILGAILSVVFVAMCLGGEQINPNIPPEDQEGQALITLMPCGSFLAGVLVFELREHLRRNGWILLAALSILVIPFPTGLHMGLEMIAIPYAAIHIGLTPPGRTAVLVRPGDVSFGVYIYSFFIQQAIVQEIPGITPLEMLAIAVPASWLVGFVSWHALEHRALGMKKRLSGTKGLADRPGHDGAGPAAASPPAAARAEAD